MVPHSDGSTDLLAPPSKEEAKAGPQTVLGEFGSGWAQKRCRGIVFRVVFI